MGHGSLQVFASADIWLLSLLYILLFVRKEGNNSWKWHAMHGYAGLDWTGLDLRTMDLGKRMTTRCRIGI